MRRLLPLLALVPLTSFAAVPEGAESVDIAGAVEVPLLVADGAAAVMVSATGEGDEAKPVEFLALVDLASSQSTVSDATVKALGLKKKSGKFAKGTAPVEYVLIPVVQIGAVTLHDVGAVVSPRSEMTIGFGLLDEVAAALLPSRGVLKVVPASEAAALLAEVGPATDLVKPAPEAFYEHGTKVPAFVYLAVPGKIAGHEGVVALSTSTATTSADPFDAGVGVRTETVVDSPTVAGAALAPLIVHRSGDLVDPNDKLVGKIGWDGLHNLDLAVDPAGMKVAMKAVPSPKATGSEPALAERARKVYAEATATPEEADAEEEKEETVGQGDKGDAKKVSVELDLAPALAAARFSTAGGAAEALGHYKAAADAAGDGCAAHHAYGVALIEIGGDPTSALPELRRAAEAYDRWMAQDYFARGKIADGKNSDPDAFVIAQPASCHTAWGDLAEAYLALGDDEKVEQIYQEHADLDADLPLAYGLSLLRAGKLAEAIGPIRRAVDLGRENAANVRTALVMTGDPAARSAAGVARLSLSGVGEYLWTASPAIEAARGFGGNGEARKLAQALVDGEPMSVPARLLLAREVSDAERKDVLAGAEKALVGYRALHGDTVEADAWEGLYYAIAANNVAAITATSAEYAGNAELETAAAIALRDQGDLVGAKTRRNVLVKYHPLTAVTAIDSTRLDTRLPGLPGSPRPPLQAPPQSYTTGCAEIPAAAYDAPIAGTWVTTADTKDRVAFQADRWCVFDDTGAVRARGGAASWSVYACPGEAPAADKPLQETYFVLRDTEHALVTCNRYVQVGDRIGMYGQACPGSEPFSTYGASGRLGEWQRTQDKAPDACWIDPAPVPPGKKGK